MSRGIGVSAKVERKLAKLAEHAQLGLVRGSGVTGEAVIYPSARIFHPSPTKWQRAEVGGGRALPGSHKVGGFLAVGFVHLCSIGFADTDAEVVSMHLRLQGEIQPH